jgi:cytidylate kinase
LSDPGMSPLPPGAVVVALDGPAGSGKRTVGQEVAKRAGLPYLDTGSLYRAVTYEVLQRGYAVKDVQMCATVAQTINLDPDGPMIDGVCVANEIRAAEVSQLTPAVAAHEGVRLAVTRVIREYVSIWGGVVDGRDIGTEVFPDATLKVYLDADIHERTARRSQADGREVSWHELAARDYRDATHPIGPLARSPEAHYIDSTGRSAGEVAEEVIRLLNLAVPRRGQA